jgi:hypothetical protein
MSKRRRSYKRYWNFNRYVAGRTFKEWRLENREVLLEKKREDWEQNANEYNLKRR